MNDKGADQTVRMRRLVCAFVVGKPLKTGFSLRGPYSDCQGSGFTQYLNIKDILEKSLKIKFTLKNTGEWL